MASVVDVRRSVACEVKYTGQRLLTAHIRVVHIIMSKNYVHEFQVHMNNFVPFN